jgi:hypothetical protein
LGETLKQLKWLQERALAKARHREAMSKGERVMVTISGHDV